MTFRMGYWDCPSCNKKRNLGPSTTCEQCGRPRGPNIAFYTDDSAPVIEDPELVARARAGADWKCKYCGADNRAGHLDCHNCGAGPDGTVRRQEKFTALGPPPKPGLSGKTILAIVLGAIATLSLLVYFAFIRTKPMEVTVTEVAWVKSRDLLKDEEVERADWKDSVPAGAKELRSETRSRTKTVQDGTKKVKTGRKDLGNGMFEDVYKEEPNMVQKQVDDTWVTYRVRETRTVRVAKNETTDGSEPDDPKASEKKLGADERWGDLSNVARLSLKGANGKKYEYEVDASKDAGAIGRFKKGASYVAEVNGMGAVVRLRGP
jgi:hypothetical protein